MYPRSVSLILAGGMALGAYQAGIFQALDESRRITPVAIAGSSIGAINGAIIAGNPAERRLERLQGFWSSVATEAVPSPWLDPFGLAEQGPLRHARNWMNVAATRLGGARGLFHPAPGAVVRSEVPSIYDNSETRATLAAFIDFERLNSGEVRFCCAATDIRTAETIFFDTGHGDRIAIDHLLASSGMLPNMQPVRIEGRLLADGGLSANAPLEPFLLADRAEGLPPLCLLVDLFSPHGGVPGSLEQAMQRSTELQFAAQTRLRLETIARLRNALDQGGTDLLYLSLKARPDEAGAERQYDFSRATLAERHRAGVADGAAAMALLDVMPQNEAGLHIHYLGPMAETSRARSAI